MGRNLRKIDCTKYVGQQRKKTTADVVCKNVQMIAGRKKTEGGITLFQSLILVITITISDIFLSTPSFVHRVDAKVPSFRDGTLVPSFLYTVIYCRVQRHRAPAL